ncbi:hypothetical protein OLZ32_11255 [Rhizobium sp. 1AS11]|uniref:hypothetical protein n=1 Tax=Rhizobium acaciae TaxID=2989736 RepID=UPI00222030CD|nr:hypothetical protein [Rhizobium acaciae]MCW1409063.1 hypothetical protein [Rhizobium acaciae]MCW1740982.1 hypothetical protein [Rhizobium acaciae]MCW1749255.1 hypothetical protein [Rhizobium acaciae]
MTGGQSTLQRSLRRIREPLQAKRRLIVPLSADNRMINLVAVRSFPHEPISAAIGSRGRENFPDISLLMDAMELRQYARLDGPAWYCRAAVSCILPNTRGISPPRVPKNSAGSADRSMLPRTCPAFKEKQNAANSK